jgi:hypothetical protein
MAETRFYIAETGFKIVSIRLKIEESRFTTENGCKWKKLSLKLKKFYLRKLSS